MSDEPPDAAADLDFRRRHVGRAVTRATWAFEARFLDAIHAAGFDDFRQADATIVRLLPVDGGRLTEVAERAGITRQGVGKLVDGLVARGYLLKEPDPSDGRAHRLIYTPRGRALLAAAARVILDLEDAWAARVGAERLAIAKAVCFELADAFGGADYL